MKLYELVQRQNMLLDALNNLKKRLDSTNILHTEYGTIKLQYNHTLGKLEEVKEKLKEAYNKCEIDHSYSLPVDYNLYIG